MCIRDSSNGAHTERSIGAVPEQSPDDGVEAVLQATIDTLQGQLEVKDRQIEQQDQTITRLTDALAAAQQTAAAAQALHAGTIQQQLITGEAGTDQQLPETTQRQRPAEDFQAGIRIYRQPLHGRKQFPVGPAP